MSPSKRGPGNPNWKKGGKSPNPSGKAKAGKFDAWINAVTGLGSTTRDKSSFTTHQAVTIADDAAQDLWRGNDVAAKIVETYPEEMLRAGWDLVAQDDEENEAAEQMGLLAAELDLDCVLEKALQFEQAYGGAAIFPILNDGQSNLAEPLRPEAVMSIDHLMVLEPRELKPESYYSDPTRPKFGLPERYYMQPLADGVASASQTVVHESRLVLFPGIRTSRRMTKATNQGWGDSILTRCFVVMRDYGVAWQSIGHLLQEFAQAVYKLKNLAAIAASSDLEGAKARFEAMEIGRSALRAIVLDAEEDWDRKQTPLTGVPEILREFATRLAAAADMPVTVLMGISPAGLNATGESDRALFYDKVARRQRTRLRPRHEAILRLIFQARVVGPNELEGFSGEEPENWSVQYRPLWEPSRKEQVDSRNAQANADKVYFEMGALSPEEIRQSRFGGDEFGWETKLDQKAYDDMLGEQEADKEAAQRLAEEQAKAKQVPGDAPKGDVPKDEGGKEPKADTLEIVEDVSRQIRALEAGVARMDFVEKRGEKWVVLSHEGKVLGTHDTEEDAKAQLRAVEAAKHAKG